MLVVILFDVIIELGYYILIYFCLILKSIECGFVVEGKEFWFFCKFKVGILCFNYNILI